MKMQWDIIHECDDDDGNPTQWALKINHPEYGKYCWVSNMGGYYSVEVNVGGFIELVRCKTLASAKKWVARYLVKKR